MYAVTQARTFTDTLQMTNATLFPRDDATKFFYIVARISVPIEAFLAAANKAAYVVLTARVLVPEILRFRDSNAHAVGSFQLEADLTRAHVTACV